MGMLERLRGVGLGSRERRKSPRVLCRLRCTIRERKRVQARVLDVSEGGLCVLSPVPFKPKKPLVIDIDVPPHGPVRVEAVAWHMRQVKSNGSGRKAWSIGMMISKAAPGFASLLPGGEQEFDAAALAEASSSLPPLDAAPDIDQLGPELLSDDLVDDLAPLTSQEQEAVAQPEAADRGDETLKLYRVRVKAQTGPRSRTLTLGGVSADEVEKFARAELGDEWIVIDVKPS